MPPPAGGRVIDELLRSKDAGEVLVERRELPDAAGA
jgi:hypothetical protein